MQHIFQLTFSERNQIHKVCQFSFTKSYNFHLFSIDFLFTQHRMMYTAWQCRFHHHQRRYLSIACSKISFEKLKTRYAFEYDIFSQVNCIVHSGSEWNSIECIIYSEVLQIFHGIVTGQVVYLKIYFLSYCLASRRQFFCITKNREEEKTRNRNCTTFFWIIQPAKDIQ